MLGRRVIWRSSFRDYEGVVVVEQVREQRLSVYEFVDREVLEVRSSDVTMRDPALREYCEYYERGAQRSLRTTTRAHATSSSTPHSTKISELEILIGGCEAVIDALERISLTANGGLDNRMTRAREIALDNVQEKRKRAVHQRHVLQRSDNDAKGQSKGTTKDNERENVDVLLEEIDETEWANPFSKRSGLQRQDSDAKEVPDEEEDHSPQQEDSPHGSRRIKNNLSFTRPGERMDDEAEEVDEEEDDENEESDEEASEDDDDDDDDDDEDDDEDDEEEEDSDEDEDEDEYQNAKVDIKVTVLPTKASRGFPRYKLTEQALQDMIDKLQRDYLGLVSLHYTDLDGDDVHIVHIEDLIYVVRQCKRLQRCKRIKDVTVKLTAQVVMMTNQEAEPKEKGKEYGNRRKEEAESFYGKRSPRAEAKHSHAMYSDGDTSSLSPLVANVSQETQMNHSTYVRFQSNNQQQQPFNDSVLSASAHGFPSIGSVSSRPQQHQYQQQQNMIDGYDIVWKRGDIIGCGSFGKVYSGINLTSGEKLAVKEVELMRSKQAKEQIRALQREVMILSRLTHPNIIRYLGTECAEDQSTLRIFLELATDGSLKDTLQQFGAFPESLIERYGQDIVRGLSYLHSQRMIHRDIKPANLLLTRGVVKLADFGCSSSFGFLNMTESAHSTIAGTTIYMAPEVMQAGSDITDSPLRDAEDHEQVVNVRKYGRKADIWSLGMTLIELATACPPFKNAPAAIYAVCVSRKLPSFPEDFSPIAHAFLTLCLEYDPSQRADCDELLAHAFLMPKSMEQIRAQSVQTARNKASHLTSTVQLHVPSDFDWSVHNIDTPSSEVHPQPTNPSVGGTRWGDDQSSWSTTPRNRHQEAKYEYDNTLGRADTVTPRRRPSLPPLEHSTLSTSASVTLNNRTRTMPSTHQQQYFLTQDESEDNHQDHPQAMDRFRTVDSTIRNPKAHDSFFNAMNAR